MDLKKMFATENFSFEPFDKTGGTKYFEMLGGCEKLYKIEVEGLEAPLVLDFKFVDRKGDCLLQINSNKNFKDPMNLE
jgi:hypothetical protein